jgi:hypothetical protein
MDLVGGAVAAGATIAVVYLVRRSKSRPAQTASGQRGQGSTGRLPKRSWLVRAYNASGARKVDSDSLSDATAELAGRAAGDAGRRTKRRWRIVKTAAIRVARNSHDKRQRRWESTGGPTPILGPRAKQRKPDATPAKSDQPKPDTQPPATSGGGEPPKRHLRAVPDQPKSPGDPVTTTADTTPTPTVLATPDAPPDWALMADRVRNFNPENDSALLAFMRGESVGVLAYAEAMEQARDNCVNDVGLDPAAVAGFTAYSEHVSDAAARMSEAYKTFVAVYGEVLQLAANGVVMPYNGRFWTGEAG